jgi:hypothetical protein
MTEYLIREEEYIPWVAAINNFQVGNNKKTKISRNYVILLKSSLQDKKQHFFRIIFLTMTNSEENNREPKVLNL